MANSVNNIFKMSMTVRNLLGSSRYTTVRLLGTSYAKFTTEGSNILQPQVFDYKQTPEMNQYRKCQFRWKSCKDSSEVFNLFNGNIRRMNGIEAVEALSALFTLDKQSDVHDGSIRRRKEFASLCEIVKKDIRKLQQSDIIEILKTLTYFQVPASSILVQSLLQIIRHSINTLSLEQIIFIDFLLTRCNANTPLIEALKMALPIVFQTHVKSKLDTENLDSLVNSLTYLSTLDSRNETLPYIMNALNKFNEHAIDHRRAEKIFMALLMIRNQDINIELVQKVQNIIIQYVDKIHAKRLELIIRKIALKLQNSEDYFYNEGLVEAIVQAVVSKDMGVSIALNILSNLNEIKFTSSAILDYIAAKCFEDKSILNELKTNKVLDIICGMSLADYKPIFWDSLKDSFLKEQILESRHQTLTKTALFLASLDCYWPQLLEKIFEDKKFESNNLLGTFSYKEQKNLLLLHYAVMSFCPDYSGPLLSKEVIELFESSFPKIKLSSLPLKSALESSLGGPQYVKSYILTPFAYYIDHLIIMRKGGFPIAINNDESPTIQKLSDIKPIPDSQVILIMYIPKHAYSCNSQRLTGMWSLIIKILKTQSNYTVIPIFSDMWTSFTEPEQVRYVSQAIRLKSDELSASINS
ncbi:FAST kinase domain-containing protein 5, mitochondrial [Microplitis demolitor]|uniref:FAST kinase domain-containing protein 5, mitochondrial n=1 Tax=Microplitis demolitor TaxID=69319 RepID=UPI0004CD9C43|nr:FAST kinase domain-containing protein 5, mitochondrial [Microplitis demolitor]